MNNKFFKSDEYRVIRILAIILIIVAFIFIFLLSLGCNAQKEYKIIKSITENNSDNKTIEKIINNKDAILWFDKKLTYKDYKIKKYNSKDKILFCSCTGLYLIIDYDENNKESYSSISAFFKSCSYVTNIVSFKDTSYLLKHEQGHFDIVEYINRNLNSTLKKVTDTATASKMFSYYNNILYIIQRKYDIETNYSSDTLIQMKWNDKIKDLLKE